MQRFVIFSFLLLIVLAFLFGVNIGKKVQIIDTPVKTAVTKIMVTKIITPTPSATPSATLKPTLPANRQASPTSTITP